MAIVDTDILADVLVWLPPQNQLTDTQLLVLINKVISVVGSDDQYYDEVLCKSLKAAAKQNKSMSSLNDGIKREKSYMREVEYYNQLSANQWDDWLDNLPCLCASLGYTGLQSSVSMGFYGRVATPVQAPICNPPYGSLADLDCEED